MIIVLTHFAGKGKKSQWHELSQRRFFTLIRNTRGISIQGEVRNVEISRVTQQLLCSKSHDFLAIFALAHSKINQIA